MDEIREVSNESFEKQEQKRFKFQISDAREKPDPGQELALAERLEADEVDIALQETKEFLGDYSQTDPPELSIKMIEGNLGQGTIRDKVIEIEMPAMDKAIDRLQEILQPRFEELSGEQCREIFLALCASTSLHEGIHGLLDSTPGSKFARDLERVSGIKDPGGERSTLLDEGIAYAAQGIYAPKIEPVGSLAPRAKETDEEIVKKRKRLGERLRPKVTEYLEEKKTIDESFLFFATQSLSEVESV